jgi:uncharacterized protein (DUF362 family)
LTLSIDERSVFIYKTGMKGYSTEWQDHASYPELIALKTLGGIAREATGTNLFEEIIRPGDCVVIKPNLVREWHSKNEDLYAVITHPSIIRAVIDEAYLAMKGDGQIIIADAPMSDADFPSLLSVTGLEKIVDYYWRTHRFDIFIRDLRQFRYQIQERTGGYVTETRVPLPGDPEGYQDVNLGPDSAFFNLEGLNLLEGTDITRRQETINHHTNNDNRYLISQTILNADVLISVPKLKTHSKVGITVNCKGMVGINGDKNRLPHFRWGSITEGGDQYPPGSQTRENELRMHLGRFVSDKLLSQHQAWADAVLWGLDPISSRLAKLFHFKSFDPVNGDWPGNDTAWRLAVDLIRVAIFANQDGKLQDAPQRRFLSIVDGIIAGEGQGPLAPTPKVCGVLAIGTHPVAVDLTCACLMGLDYHKIKYLNELCHGNVGKLKPNFDLITPEDLKIYSNYQIWNDIFNAPRESLLNFIPPKLWQGQVEKLYQ